MARPQTPEEKEYQEYMDYSDYMDSQGGDAPAPAPVNKKDGIINTVRAALGKGGIDWDAAGKRQEAIDSGAEKAPEPVAGTPPLAAPSSALPKIASLMAKVTSSAPGRIASNGAQGFVSGSTRGITDPNAPSKTLQERLGDGLKEAAVGTGFGVAGEAVGAGVSALKSVGRRAARFTKPQAQAYVEDPKGIKDMSTMIEDNTRLPELQDQAVGAINESRKHLRGAGLQNAKNLRELLTGKQVEISPADYTGMGDDVEGMIKAKYPQETLGMAPQKMKLDANEANDLKRLLQSKANYKPGTPTDPTQDARRLDASGKAGALRKQIEEVGGDGVKVLNQEMQQGALTSEALRKGAKNNPLAFVSTESPDRVATIARAAKLGGDGGLQKFGARYGAAKSMSMKDVDDALSRQAQKVGGRAALRLADVMGKGKDATMNPASEQALLDLMFKKSSEK